MLEKKGAGNTEGTTAYNTVTDGYIYPSWFQLISPKKKVQEVKIKLPTEETRVGKKVNDTRYQGLT